MNVLFTAVGKRIELIKHFKKWGYFVAGIDSNELVPAKYFVDYFCKVPKWNERKYLDIIFEICKAKKIDILIPLYEREFILLCENRERFNQIGTTLLLSHKKIIEICNDKWESYKFFVKNNINTPLTYSKNGIWKALKKSEINFPLIIKPVSGMGSKGCFKINDIRELEFFCNYINNGIIQKYIEGIEYTIDVLCDFQGNCISVVPRERIEVINGEVSKSRTIKDNRIINATLDLCNKLKINDSIKPVGPLTIQCIVDKNGEIKFIEINPRFGGGVPLTFEAGVPYGDYLARMMHEEKIAPQIGQFKEIIMLRFNDSIFVSEEK